MYGFFFLLSTKIFLVQNFKHKKKLFNLIYLGDGQKIISYRCRRSFHRLMDMQTLL